MNQNNLDYLKEGLKYMGFGTELQAQLEKNVQQQQPAFELRLQKPYFNSTIDYTLHFRKSDQNDMYFFNKYEATLKPDTSAEKLSQTFYINKNNGITAKEAYNLLEGRSVHKELVNAEGQTYKAWLQLDLAAKDQHGNHKVKQFHENYGFDLEKTLDKFHIKELQDPQQKEQLLYSLRKGNQQQVTALEEGYEVKRVVEASPQFKTINVYNEQRQQVMRETIQKHGAGKEEAPKQKAQQAGIENKQTPENKPEKKQVRQKKVSI